MALDSELALGRQSDADRTNGHNSMVTQRFGPERWASSTEKWRS
jgi:hypothetical protein